MLVQLTSFDLEITPIYFNINLLLLLMLLLLLRQQLSLLPLALPLRLSLPLLLLLLLLQLIPIFSFVYLKMCELHNTRMLFDSVIACNYIHVTTLIVVMSGFTYCVPCIPSSGFASSVILGTSFIPFRDKMLHNRGLHMPWIKNIKGSSVRVHETFVCLFMYQTGI